MALRIIKWFGSASLATFFLFAPQSFALSIPDAPSNSYILDLAELISPDAEDGLNEKITTLESESTAEIAILTIKTLEGTPIESFALDVFRSWGVGQEGRDTGILILLVEEDQSTRIEVGYGLEGRVPDATAYAIIQQQMIPEFSNGNFEIGIEKGVDSLIEKIMEGGTDALLLETADFYDDTPPFFRRQVLEETVGILAFLAILTFFLGFIHLVLLEKPASILRKLPIPQILLILIAYLNELSIIPILIGLLAAHSIYLLFERLKWHKVPWNAKSSRGSVRSGSYRSRSSSRNGSSSSGGFGGGSSGGGGANGKW